MKIRLKDIILKYQPGIAISRNSFLALVELNAFGLASKFYRVAKDNKSAGWLKLSEQWKKFGGNPSSLMKAIKRGMNTEYKIHAKQHQEKKAVFNYDPEGMDDMEADNFAVAATIASLTATATPIIVKFKDIMKTLGVSDEQLKDMAGKGLQGLKELAKNKKNKTTNNPDGTQTIDISTPSNIPNIEKKTPVMALTVIAVVVLAIIVTTGKK